MPSNPLTIRLIGVYVNAEDESEPVLKPLDSTAFTVSILRDEC